MLVGPARMRSNPNAVRRFIRYRCRVGSRHRGSAARITVRRSGRIARAFPARGYPVATLATLRKTAPVTIARVLIAALHPKRALHSVYEHRKETDSHASEQNSPPVPRVRGP